MNPTRKALILAGGQGTRLRRLGEVVPKCLIPIYDQPLLIRHIEQCARAGVSEIIISVGIRFAALVKEVLKLYVPPANISLRCVIENQPLGPIKAFTSFASEMQGSAFLLVLGDEYFESNVPFDVLRNGFGPDPMILGVVRTKNRSRIDCNVQLDESNKVTKVIDKPTPDLILGNLRWCGMAAFDSNVLNIAVDAVNRDQVPGKHIGDLLEAVRRKIPSTGILEFPEIHLNVNGVDDVLRASLLEARKRWSREQPDELDHLNQAIDLLFSALNV